MQRILSQVIEIKDAIKVTRESLAELAGSIEEVGQAYCAQGVILRDLDRLIEDLGESRQ